MLLERKSCRWIAHSELVSVVAYLTIIRGQANRAKKDFISTPQLIRMRVVLQVSWGNEASGNDL